MLKLIKFLLLLVIAALGAAFAYVNPGFITVSYYFGEIAMPMGVFIFALTGAGILIGLIAGILIFVRVKRENVDLRRQARLASQEVNNLRAMPLRDR